jgi:hypothetical protein
MTILANALERSSAHVRLNDSRRGARTRAFLRLSVFGLVLLTAACAGTRRPGLVAGGSLAVPAARGSYYLFSPDGVKLHKGTAVTPVEGVPSSAGVPMLKAFDMESATACVAYSKAVVFVDLSSEKIRSSVPHDLGRQLRGTSIRENRALVWSDRVVMELEKGGGSMRWDVGGLLEAKGVTHIDYCFPLDDQVMLLIGSRSLGFASDGDTICMRLDRSSGPWMIKNSNSIGAVLSSLHQAGSEGSKVYVAGLFDKPHLSTGGGGHFYQDALVFRIDLETLESTEVLRSTRQQKQNQIRDIAVGPDSVSLLFVNGLLEVYKVSKGQRATTPTYDGFHQGASSIAWVSENEIMVTTRKQSEIIKFQ